MVLAVELDAGRGSVSVGRFVLTSGATAVATSLHTCSPAHGAHDGTNVDPVPAPAPDTAEEGEGGEGSNGCGKEKVAEEEEEVVAEGGAVCTTAPPAAFPPLAAAAAAAAAASAGAAGAATAARATFSLSLVEDVSESASPSASLATASSRIRATGRWGAASGTAVSVNCPCTNPKPERFVDAEKK